LSEFYIAWYSGHEVEQYQFLSRAFGFMLGTGGSYFYAVTFWGMVICNVVIPHLFWSKKIRTSIVWMFVISIFVNIGMWLERFNIFILSLHNDYLPASWGYYIPTLFDWMVVIGSFGFFFTLFLVFCRVFPTLAIAELKATLPAPSTGSRLHKHAHGHDDHHGGHTAPAAKGGHSHPAEAH
jgi:molybdopterin-containing oxidoreductase family membrane subunit